ncbi:replication-relaxation family protein [Rhodococcus sp. NPDC004095]
MEILHRDMEILRLVARFGQLTTAHLQALVFHQLTTDTQCRRRLTRLVEADLLARVQQRVPGGVRGGSPQYCYQLGRKGWRLFFDERYRFSTVVKLHTLCIADLYVRVVEQERVGAIDILDYATEPDSWLMVAGEDLRPDLYLDLGLRERAERVAHWIEVDLGTERRRQIVEKLGRYKRAYERSHEFPGDIFPQIVFLATTSERLRELRTAVSMARLPEGLVVVEPLDSYPQSLVR